MLEVPVLRFANMLVTTALLVLLFAPPSLEAQAVLNVETNLPGSILMTDTTRLGPVSTGPFTVAAGRHHLRLLPPPEKNWSVVPLQRAVTASRGETLRVALPFPHYYRVESVPAAAEVYHLSGEDRTLLGRTPLLYSRKAPLDGRLLITAPEYLPKRLEAGHDVWNARMVYLEPVEDVSRANISWEPPEAQNYWIDVAAASVAVAATAVSIHYKFKADDAYEEYLATGDPGLRPTFERYDRRALIALGVGQVGLGIFAVRLIL